MNEARSIQTPTFPIRPGVLFCAALYLLAVLWGMHSAIGSQHSILNILIPYFVWLCMGIWAVNDARRRQQPIVRSAWMWFFLLAAIVVPVYVIATRGWRGVGWLALHVVGWMIVSVVAMNLTGLAYFGSDWWQRVPPA